MATFYNAKINDIKIIIVSSRQTYYGQSLSSHLFFPELSLWVSLIIFTKYTCFPRTAACLDQMLPVPRGKRSLNNNTTANNMFQKRRRENKADRVDSLGIMFTYLQLIIHFHFLKYTFLTLLSCLFSVSSNYIYIYTFISVTCSPLSQNGVKIWCTVPNRTWWIKLAN